MNIYKQYLVIYDLNRPGQDYPTLWKALQRAQATKVQYSAWVVKSSYSAIQVRDWAKTLIDPNDRVMVVELTPGTWGSYNLMAQI